jgi:ribosomal subunit interface protein
MRIRFWFDRVSSTGDIKRKIARKFASLDKYLRHVSSDLRQGMVELSKGERFGYRVKAIFKVPGKAVVAEGQSKTLLSAVDVAYGKAAREIRTYLERLRDVQRK